MKLFGDIPKVDPYELHRLMTISRLKKSNPRRDEFRDPDDESCVLDHLQEGFEGQMVYVWRGPFKGKFGMVLQGNSNLARVSFESAMQGDSWSYVLKDCLVAFVYFCFHSHLHVTEDPRSKCGCVLEAGVKLPWSKEEIRQLPSLFDRSIHAAAPRSKTPPVPADENEASVTSEEMFHGKFRLCE